MKTDVVIKQHSILSLPVQDKRCPDYDDDCKKVPDPYCCFFDCENKFKGGQAKGYCPLIHSSLW